MTALGRRYLPIKVPFINKMIIKVKFSDVYTEFLGVFKAHYIEVFGAHAPDFSLDIDSLISLEGADRIVFLVDIDGSTDVVRGYLLMYTARGLFDKSDRAIISFFTVLPLYRTPCPYIFLNLLRRAKKEASARGVQEIICDIPRIYGKMERVMGCLGYKQDFNLFRGGI